MLSDSDRAELEALPPLPDRPESGHKGTFGTVLIVGGTCAGEEVMVGGPALAALAALRAGCGLAWLAMPRPLLASALEVTPEATGVVLPVDEHDALRPSAAAEALHRRMDRVRAIAVGPGLGTSREAAQLVHWITLNASVPVVIDADALNCLAASPDFARDLRAPCVMTPHPGEYGRLAAALALPPLRVESLESAKECAQQLAARVGAVVVLKGACTTVADLTSVWQLHAGTPALATGGSGDVLTGVMASLVSQSGAGPMTAIADSARQAVALHGLVARQWTARHGTAGLVARDIAGGLPDAAASVRSLGWTGAFLAAAAS